MTQILIAEDEERIAAFVAKGLRAARLRPDGRPDGARGLRPRVADGRRRPARPRPRARRPGRLHGAAPAARGRARPLPVIILTARTSVTDTVAGLERGADDYMAKPFRFEELLARMRLRLRTEAPAGRGRRC